MNAMVEQDVHQIDEGGEAGEGEEAAPDDTEVESPQGREAKTSLGRQSSDREGLRRRPGADLHRRHAGLET